MGKILLSICVLLFCFGDTILAQCTPDPGCIDIDDPGQVCPPELPEGTVSEYYEETVTVIAPGSAEIEGNTVTLIKIEVTDIQNLPPGITWEPNAQEFLADQSYCILLSGTPATAGTYTLHIKVIPYIDFYGTPVAGPEQTDSTSSSLTINESYGINKLAYNEFRVLRNKPNPFKNTTRIGFISGSQNDMELRVYNVLGKEVYYESVHAQPGENYFSFTGKKLLPGIYIYNISNNSKVYVRQMIKTE